VALRPPRCHGWRDCWGALVVGARKPMTIREEIVFSIFVAAAMVMGWKLIVYALDHVLT
jgi:hypothetical protein